MIFHKLSLSDRAWAEPILRQSGMIGCEFAFGTQFVWQEVYGAEFAHEDGFLVGKSKYGYLVPIGTGDYEKIIRKIAEDATKNSKELVMYCIPKDKCALLKDIFGDDLTIEEARDDFDYIYKASDLAYLKGKKYHSKRNHITQFIKQYGMPQYEEISAGNIEECFSVAQKWQESHTTDSEAAMQELTAIRIAFDNWDALKFKGGLLRLNGEVIAFAAGESLNDDIFNVHFEKTSPEYQGAYPLINREFVANSLMDYDLIDREEDMGIEGLRKAKLSYRPFMFSEFYTGTFRI